MRRGIRTELKKRTAEHQEAKASVAKLRKTYERKIEEVQQYEEQDSKEQALARGEAWPPEHWEGPEIGSQSATSVKVSRRDRSSSSVSAASSGGGEGYLSGGDNPVFVSGATSLGSNGTPAYRDPLPSKATILDVISKRDWVGGRQSIARAVGNLGKSEKGRQTSSRLRREAEQAGTPPLTFFPW